MSQFDSYARKYGVSTKNVAQSVSTRYTAPKSDTSSMEITGPRKVDDQELGKILASLLEKKPKTDILPIQLPKVQMQNAANQVAADMEAGRRIPLAQAAFPTTVKADMAKQQYEDYKGSEEAKKNQGEANRRAWESAVKQVLSAPTVSNNERFVTTRDVYAAADNKGQELKAQADYLENQAQLEQDASVMEQDLRELENWSEDDRANLERFISERDRATANPFGEAQFDTWNLNPLLKKYGEGKVRQMAESVQRSRSQQAMRQTTEEAQKFANAHPVLGSTASVAANLAGAYTAPVEYAREMGQRTGRYATLDPNNIGNLPSAFGGTVRETVSDNIQGDGNSLLRNLAAVGYQGGMNALDSALRVAAAGGNTGISAAIAASGSFGNGLQKYSAQGASPAQAATMAFVDAGLEYATEKISDAKMLEFFNNGTKKDFVKNFLWQTFGVEPLTEEINLFAGVAAEAAILGDKASQQQQIGEMVSNGMSYEEARAEVLKQLWKEAAETYAVSAVSAGLSSAGSAALGNAVRKTQETASTDTAAPPPVQQPAEAGPPSKEQMLANALGQATGQTPAQIDQPVAKQKTDPTVAFGENPSYDNIKNINGGTNYESGLQQNDRAGSLGNLEQGVAGLQQRNGTDPERRGQPGSVAVNSRFVRVSQKLADAQTARGASVYPVMDTSSTPEAYEQALVAGRNSDKENGWCVTPKSAAELREGNINTFMNENNTVGVGVAPDGDIVAVFKNKNGGPARALDTAMPIAIEMGGDRLDCYGIGLVRAYARYGFVPVARVQFNPEYANEGWTPEKGTPDIFFMMHNGDSADIVASNIGKYPVPTKAELDALPVYGKDDYDAAMKYRNRLIDDRRGNTTSGYLHASASKSDVTDNGPDSGTVGAMQSQFNHEVKQSKVYGNTYQNTPYADVHDIGRAAKKADPNIDQYDVITEAESVHEAELRTETGRDRLAEHRALMKKDGWTSADNDTAMRLLTVYRREGKKDRFLELSRKQRQMGTQAGQMVQSFAKYSREDATVAVQDAIADLDELTIDQVDRTFWKPKQETKGAHGNKDAFQKWKESITGSLLEVANDIENVEDGDKTAMKDLVRQIANLRHTTAWAGYSSDLSRRTERGLDKMDFDTLKTVAKTQLSMIPNDFRKRDTGEILKQIRVQNMLFTITTKFKNDAGNITNGIMDAISDSYGGRMIDAVIGKWTGKRTVGNDLKYASEYSKAARDAADVASAFVSLDIPMEVDAKYSSGKTRTWSPNTANVFGRLMSAYEKHMKYALEVSDKFYEGGAAHVVNKSLRSLGEKSGLTPEQIQDIAQKTGERRTFKDPGVSVDKSGQPKNGRMLASANVGLQKALNNIGTENIGLGDMVMPFAAVSGEVKQVGMDYTGGGLISGMKEIISIAKDVRNGKEIDPYRQRTAATNFGRGMTGVGLIAAFTAFAAAGAIKVHNDRDSEERMMNQTQGLSGAQWNLNSSLRWWEAIMNGATAKEAAKAAEWQSSDKLVTIDFLEPYNTQMHIGYLLSQGDDIPTAIMQGNFNSLLGMPMMQTLSDLADLQQAFTEVSDGDMDGVRDAAGQLVGTVAGSIVPNWMRKTAQVIDPYYRDTYDTNPFRKSAKEVLAATPILSAALPKKYDNLGKEQRRFDNSEWLAAAFDALVTPWDTETYQTNDVYQEIERLNAIDGFNVTPPQPKRKITYTDNTGTKHENYNLSPEQYETLQRVQGQTAQTLLNQCIESPVYAAMTDQQKADVFSYIYDYAREKARVEALGDYEMSGGWMDDVLESGADGLLRRTVETGFSHAIDRYMEGDVGAAEELEKALAPFNALPGGVRNDMMVNTGGKTGYFLQAQNAGVDAQTFLDMYGKFREIDEDGANASEKALEWAYTLENAKKDGAITDAQRKVLENKMVFMQMFPAGAEKFNSMVENGISAEKAKMIVNMAKALNPESGKSSVSDVQEARAIAGARLTSGEKAAAMMEYLSDAQDKNLRDMMAEGYSPEEYAAVYEIYSSTTGTGRKRRVIAEIQNDLGLSYQEARILYDIFNKA